MVGRSLEVQRDDGTRRVCRCGALQLSVPGGVQSLQSLRGVTQCVQ